MDRSCATALPSQMFAGRVAKAEGLPRRQMPKFSITLSADYLMFSARFVYESASLLQPLSLSFFLTLTMG